MSVYYDYEAHGWMDNATGDWASDPNAAPVVKFRNAYAGTFTAEQLAKATFTVDTTWEIPEGVSHFWISIPGAGRFDTAAGQGDLSAANWAALNDVQRRLNPDGAHGGMGIGTGIALVVGSMFTAGAFAGLSGAFGAEAVAATTTDAYSIGEVVTQSIAGGATETIGGITVDGLENSIGNFGDWFQTSDGTMYNPNTGEYLMQDGTYNPGSLGSSAPGGADAYSFSSDFLPTAGQASAPNSLNDMLGKLSNGLKSLGSGVAKAGGMLSGMNRVQPNMSSANGLASTNLGLPLMAVAAFMLMKG